MNSEKKIYQIPEFTGENIPLKEAARIMGKDYQFVRVQESLKVFYQLELHVECLAQTAIHFTSVQGCSGNTRGMCTVVRQKNSKI